MPGKPAGGFHPINRKEQEGSYPPEICWKQQEKTAAKKSTQPIDKGGGAGV